MNPPSGFDANILPPITEDTPVDGASVDTVHRPKKHKRDVETKEAVSTSQPMDMLVKPTYNATELSRKNDFFVVFQNSAPFKDLIDLISPVLETIHINIVDKVTKSGKRFRGITINSMDTKKVSMIVARLTADEIFQDGQSDQSFCVKTDLFASLIKPLKSGYCIEMFRPKNDVNIHLRGCNPTRPNYTSNIRIPTLDNSEVTHKLDMIDYNFIVDIDLHILREKINLAQNPSINSEHISFQIQEAKDEKNGTKTTKVIIALDMDDKTSGVESEEIFRSVNKWDKTSTDTAIITTSDALDTSIPEQNMETVLDERFSTKYLKMFLKSMDRNTIALRMSPAKPLVIQYPLDNEESYCNFILVPKSQK